MPPALCLKSGNATILRGGSEALRSNQAIAACVHEGLRAAGLPENAVQVVATTDRAAVGHLIADDEHVDVIVPRGGKGLIERIAREAKRAGDQAPRRRVPRLHRRRAPTSTWRSASPTTRRRSATRRATRWRRCSCTPTSRARVLPPLARRSTAARASSCAADERARALVPAMKPATEDDWYTEYLAPILAVRVVDSLDEAIDAHRAATARSTPTRSSPRTTRARCASCARSTRAR